MAPRLRIGLTGGIASGKSTVARRFTELGVPVIDADESARVVVAPGQPGLDAVAEAFGSSVLTSKGELNRRALRDLVFSAPASRRRLESILHPLIRAEMEHRAAVATGPYLVLAIPLLLEGGTQDRVDRILVVDASEEAQVQRVTSRDGGSEDQARAILAAQIGRAERIKAADDVLRNQGSLQELRMSVDALHSKYLGLARVAPTLI
jgi:dephospho-CoA kinase